MNKDDYRDDVTAPGDGLSEEVVETTKSCPFCGRPILVKALQCTYCKRWMPDVVGPRRPPAASFDERAYSRAQPTKHFVLLTVLTIGAYEFYWFYRNWRDLEEHLGVALRPGLRTAGLFVPLLNVFMVYDQLRLVAAVAGRAGVHVPYSPGMVTAVFFALAFVSNWTMVWVLSLFTVLPLIPVQGTLNRYWRSEEPDRPVREEFTGSEVIMMALGFLLFMAAVMGTVGT